MERTGGVAFQCAANWRYVLRNRVSKPALREVQVPVLETIIGGQEQPLANVFDESPS